MKVPPLSKRPLNADDEHISSRQAAHDGFGGDRDDSNGHPTGMGACAQSWMHTDAVGGASEWPSSAYSLAASMPSTSTASPKDGGEHGARPPPSQQQPHPRRRCPPHPPRQASHQCRAATRSAPTASSYARPNTRPQHTQNPNCPKKPQKTPKEAQRQQQNTTSRS